MARLSSAIVADASVHGGRVIEFVPEGRALPAAVTHESFPFGAFFEFVGISQSMPQGNAMALCRIPVPTFAEGGRNIRELSLRVLADNKDLVIVEIDAPELGYSDFVIGHKTTRTSCSVPTDVVAMIRAVGTSG